MNNMKTILRGVDISKEVSSVRILPRTDIISEEYYTPREVIVEYKDGRKEWYWDWECIVEVGL